MNADAFSQIIQLAPNELKARMGELEAEVMIAAREALEATQDSEGGGKPSVAITLKVKINLAKSPVSFTTTGAVSVNFKTEGEEVRLDDGQPELFAST